MGAQECFPIQHLSQEEAWRLFKKTTGDSVENNLELQPTAREVVKECEGLLPVAIVTIAKALKDESLAVWKNAFEELRSSAPTNIREEEKVFSCLEWSYNHLKGNEVKSLFLLCGSLSYGDISMDHLLRYAMGLDLFDHIKSLEQARNKLVTLVEILKASSLLLDGVLLCGSLSHGDISMDHLLSYAMGLDLFDHIKSLEQARNKLVTLVEILKASSLLLDDEDHRHKFEGGASRLLFMDVDNKFVRLHDVVRDVAKYIASKDPH
ncbi:putative disease resistance protein [Vitis vinifera]|uniref:Putative disease resistance protein n=1 Tax=Vitis vinifera TaxID=29760 RepID=A0A438HBJ2_VITVI|nr:putative disease resistance protein [Vitis vinifera]